MVPTGVFYKGKRSQGKQGSYFKVISFHLRPHPYHHRRRMTREARERPPPQIKPPLQIKLGFQIRPLAQRRTQLPTKSPLQRTTFQRKPWILTKSPLQRIPLWTRLSLQGVPFLGMKPLP